MKVNILGLDPSLRNWGWVKGIYDTDTQSLYFYDCGVILTKPDTSKIKQSLKDKNTATTLYSSLLGLIQETDIICAELPHGSQSSRAMVSYAVCVAIIGCIQHSFKNIVEVSALDVKKIVGNRDTSKQEIISWVRDKHPELKLPKTSKDEHICDAVVAIYASLNQPKFESIINEIKRNT